MHVLNCPECGRGVPVDARTLGLCPACLVARVIESKPASHLGAGKTRHAAPVAAEVARELPQFDALQFRGQGGMATVYKARQRGQDRVVALKVFTLESESEPAFAERFAQEARVLISLSHPNIVGAYEFGRSERFAFLAMEFIHGPNLRTVLQRSADGKLPVESALAVGRSVCDALECAHAAGIVHRDIKPENILIDPPMESMANAPLDDILRLGGRVRVADFGLAKFQRRKPEGISLTSTDQCIGTAIYMAPEQMDRSNQIDARADIYSLGVVLYEMLTGELPVGRFARPSEKSSAPRRLDAIVLRCLENDPSRRYATIGDARADLSRARRPRPAALSAAALVVLGTAIGLVVWDRGKDFTAESPLVHSAALAPPTTQMPASAVPSPVVPGAAHADPRIAQIDTIPDTMRSPVVVSAIPPNAAWIGPKGGPYFSPEEDRMLQAWSKRFGKEHVVRIYVEGFRPDTLHYIAVKLRAMVGSKFWNQNNLDGNLSLAMAPVKDVREFAASIDLGKVSIDDSGGVHVHVEAAKLPPPLPPAVDDIRDSRFYSRNLADLSVWNPDRRRDALLRFRDAPPTVMRAEIAAAMGRLLDDPAVQIRVYAADALATWGGPESVEPLISALQNPWLCEKAILILGNLRAAPAAAPIAELMPTHLQECAAALKAIGPPAETAVRAQLRGGSTRVRAAAAEILATIGTDKCIPDLQDAIAYGDAPVPQYAKEAITAIRARLSPPQDK